MHRMMMILPSSSSSLSGRWVIMMMVMMMMSIRGQDTCTWWWRYCPPHHRPSLLAGGWSKKKLKLTLETLNPWYRSAIVIERIENIRKIRVYKKLSHRSAIVTGWGRTSERSRPASVLREVSVRWFSFYIRSSKSDASSRLPREHWQNLNLFSRCPSCQTSNARRCTGISHLQVFTADSHSHSIIVHFHSFFHFAGRLVKTSTFRTTNSCALVALAEIPAMATVAVL